jgi:hypothetical protein
VPNRLLVDKALLTDDASPRICSSQLQRHLRSSKKLCRDGDPFELQEVVGVNEATSGSPQYRILIELNVEVDMSNITR